MKKISKVTLVFLVCTLLISVFTFSASAKTYTGTKFGYSSDYIYVHTNKSNATLQLNFKKGTLGSYYTNDGVTDIYNVNFNVYASYEIKISAWDGSKYVPLNKYDVYCKSTNTVKLPKANTDYRIQVYQWKSSTTLTSYMDKNVVTGKLPKGTVENGFYNPYWAVLPKYSTGTLKNCTMLNSNPH